MMEKEENVRVPPSFDSSKELKDPSDMIYVVSVIPHVSDAIVTLEGSLQLTVDWCSYSPDERRMRHGEEADNNNRCSLSKA